VPCQIARGVRVLSDDDARPLLSPLELVAEFYRRAEKPIRSQPTAELPREEIRQITALLVEEVGELRSALKRRDLKDIADGLADVIYVVYGAALQFGIDLDDVLLRIHEANMSKSNADGTFPKSKAGKVLRGDMYEPPDLEEELPPLAEKLGI
jgi:predicted HAD superfamily Cof-like phosphohydrolase